METERLRTVLARVRWANLARVLAVAAVVPAVVGWARTGSSPPALPDAAPRPVVASPPPAGRARPPSGPGARGPRARGRGARGETATAPRAVSGGRGPTGAARPAVSGGRGRTGAERRGEDGRRGRGKPGGAVRLRGGAAGRRGGAGERRAERPAAAERRRVALSAPAPAAPRWSRAPAVPPDPVAAEFGAP